VNAALGVEQMLLLFGLAVVAAQAVPGGFYRLPKILLYPAQRNNVHKLSHSFYPLTLSLKRPYRYN
jgi:hypothetical protein